jgi:hypothetical protein
VTLLWAVPVVAAAVATLLVVARARMVEDEAVGLARDVRRLREIRAPLGAIRATALETDGLVANFRGRHPLDGDVAPNGAGPPVADDN